MISIIIPNFNKGDLIRQSLDSLLAQSYGDWEAVVVDDSSSDRSLDIAKEYAVRDARFKILVNESNKGGSFSRNRGVAVANGEYLMFLDSDDALAPDCLEKRLFEFSQEENRSVDMLVYPMATVKDGKTIGVWRWHDEDDALIAFLRHRIAWSIMMPIWRRTVFDRIGGFDEAFPRLQDVELHTRALMNGLRYGIARRDTPDCFYYIDEDRMTMNHAKMCERFVDAAGMYVEKMGKLINTVPTLESGHSRRELSKALAETYFAAIRSVGDAWQAGRISAELRDRLYLVLLSNGSVKFWNALYCECYRLRLNKIKGFNYLFRLLYRMVGTGLR